jgi:pyruvate kinase
MLSGETAIGEYPIEAVDMMNRVALATEPLLASRPPLAPPEFQPEELQPITHAVVYGAGHIAKVLNAKLIVVVSRSGATALALSKQRSGVPVIGASMHEATLRQMCLYWGVIPLADAPTTDSSALIEYLEQWGQQQDMLEAGDNIVLVAGIGLASKGHNMVRVHEVGGATASPAR